MEIAASNNFCDYLDYFTMNEYELKRVDYRIFFGIKDLIYLKVN